MGKKLVTIIDSDEGAKTAYVQINDADHIGDATKSGTNARHEFSTEKDADEPWKGNVRDSVAALYPGAEVHTPDSLNKTVISPALVAKGTHVMHKSEPDIAIPKEEAKRLDQTEIREFAAEQDFPVKVDDLLDLSPEAAKAEIAKRAAEAEKAAAEAEAGEVG